MKPFFVVIAKALKNYLIFDNYFLALSNSVKVPFALALVIAAFKAAGPLPFSPPSLIKIKALVTSELKTSTL